jgi:hypothetical protein
MWFKCAMMNEAQFKSRIEGLDTTFFSQIMSQTTDADKKSLLALQACTRANTEKYIYLEIGSYLGGSIQPHLLDPKCAKIYSIDKRQLVSRDERVEEPGYPGNTQEHMLSLLTALDPKNIGKIECLDGDTRSISPSLIREAPNLCFIDGEHTPSAVVGDFDFCARVCAESATIVFHDAQTVFRGLRSVVSKLKRCGRKFSAHALSDMVYSICLDKSPLRSELGRFSSQMRENDLWSPRNDLRLMKWRAIAFKQRASSLATRLLGN